MRRETFSPARAFLLGLALMIVAGMVRPAHAGPVILTTFHATDRFTANPLPNLPDGDFIQVSVIVSGASTPDPFGSLSVVATQGASTLALPFLPSTAPIITNPVYGTFIPFAGAPLGSWSVTATDSTGPSAPALTPAITTPQLVPFVTGIMVSDQGATPTVSWTLPDLTGFDVDNARIRIIDVTNVLQVFQAALPTATTSFVVPTGILLPNSSYIYRISLEDTETDVFGTHVENRSNAFSNVVQVAVPEPGAVTLALFGLAGVGGCRAWRFRKKHPAA